MTPKPQESIPVVHAGEDPDIPGSLNNANSLGNLNSNIKLSGLINNGFVSDCPVQSGNKSNQTKELELKGKNNVDSTSLTSGASVQEKPIVDFDDLPPQRTRTES